MPASQNSIDELIIKYLQQELTGEETTALNEWVTASHSNQQLFEKLVNETWLEGELKILYKYDEDKGWERIREKISFEEPQSKTPVIKMTWRLVAACAAVLLILLTGSYFLFFEREPAANDKQQLAQHNQDVQAPVSNKASIKLSDGRTVYLDSVLDGELISQGNVKLVKRSDGKISYTIDRQDALQELKYNTLTNPRGSEVIDIELSDGTHVWLNAGSSLIYPVKFIGSDRKITMNGEAYFEVAHDSHRPFKVSKAELEVTVVGTHFNINAYDDEPALKVTLLEGSVNVSRKNEIMRMKPGQQVRFNGQLEKVDAVDTDAVIAWKNGYFSFDGQDIHAMLRQLSRWYDIDVVIAGSLPDTRLVGGMARNTSLSQVLKILETMKIKFLMEGRRLTISK